MQPSEHPDHLRAMKAGAAGNLAEARALYQSCIAQAEKNGEHMLLTSYLQELAKLEGESGNRDAFEALHQRAISLFPNAPLLRMFYARDTWTVFKDKEACLSLVAVVEELLASKRWDRSQDLSPLAYQQKLETIKAWVRGEPGGPLWP